MLSRVVNQLVKQDKRMKYIKKTSVLIVLKLNKLFALLESESKKNTKSTPQEYFKDQVGEYIELNERTICMEALQKL